MLFMLSASGLQAQNPNTSWNGSVSSDWFDAANWSNGVPQSNSRVTIGWINPSNHQPVIDGTTSFRHLNMQSNNNSLTILPGSELTVSDYISISNTSSFSVEDATVNVAGNFTSQGQVQWDGGELSVGGNFTTSGLVTSFEGSSILMQVDGNWSSSGNTTLSGSEVTIDGSLQAGNAQDLILLDTTMDVFSASSFGGILTLDQGAVINFHQNLTFGFSAEIHLMDGTINLLNDFVMNSGVINVDGGEINFSGQNTIGGDGQLNVSSGNLLFSDDVSFSGNPVINAGEGNFYFGEGVTISGSATFNAQESNITFDGATWSMNGGIEFNAGTSEVVFSGGSQLITGTGGINQITFYNLSILDESQVVSLIDVLVLNDMIVDEDASFETGNDATLNVVGDVIGDPFIDTDRPYIISVEVLNESTILLLFDEALNQQSAENASNYTVEAQPAPVNATLISPNEVSLSLGFSIQEDTLYFLVANNIENINGGVISQNHRKRFGLSGDTGDDPGDDDPGDDEPGDEPEIFPAQITLVQHPSTGTAGQPLYPAPIMLVTDAEGNPVPGVTLQAQTNIHFFCGLCNQQEVTDESGIATFDFLLLNIADTGYQISFTADGANGSTVTSDYFEMTIEPSVLAQARIEGPTTLLPGKISDNYTLSITDAFGNTVVATDKIQFGLSSSSNTVSFIPQGNISIKAGDSHTTFRVKDTEPGFHFISADFDLILPQNLDFEMGAEFESQQQRSLQNRTILPASFDIEFTDHWVWIARNGNGSIQSSDWYDSANWNRETGFPVDEDVVIIRDYHADIQPKANGQLDININTLVVEGDMSVILEPNTSLTVGEIQYMGRSGSVPVIRLRSDESGTASFIHNDPGIHAVVERYFDDGAGRNTSGSGMAWHQLSSPVVDQQILDNNGGFAHQGSLFTWYEPAQQWVGFHDQDHWPSWGFANNHQDLFIPMRGYMVSYEGTPTKEFQGELQYGEVSHNLMRYAHNEDPYVGFNLIGNPFASYIDLKSAAGWQGLDALESPSIWIWDNVSGQYGAYNFQASGDSGTNGVSRYVAPTQAFWVRAASHGQALRMDERVRTHEGISQRGEKQHEPSVLRLMVSSEASSYSDQVMLEFDHPAAGNGTEKMFSFISEAPALFLARDDEPHSIAFFGAADDEGPVDLHFQAGMEGHYSLSASDFDSFGEILLEDLLTHKMHDLSSGEAYLFYGHPSDMPARFKLHVGSNADDHVTHVNEPSQDQGSMNAWAHSQSLHVETSHQRTRMEVIDTQGRVIREDVLHGSGRHQLHHELGAGVFILRLQGGDQQRSIRIVITR